MADKPEQEYMEQDLYDGTFRCNLCYWHSFPLKGVTFSWTSPEEWRKHFDDTHSHRRLIDAIILQRKELANYTPMAPAVANANLRSSYRSYRAGGNRMFPLFSSLPAEIRLQIWAYNMPRPEILTVMYDSCGPKSDDDHYVTALGRWRFLKNEEDEGNDFFRLHQRPNPFINLFICQETRFEALRSRRLESFGLVGLPGDYRSKRRWFDFDTDTYFMDTNSGRRDQDHQVLAPCQPPYSTNICQKLRFLAFSSRLWFDWPFREAGYNYARANCPCCLCNGANAAHSGDVQERFHKISADRLERVEKVSISQDRYHTLQKVEFRFSEAEECDIPDFGNQRADLEGAFGEIVDVDDLVEIQGPLVELVDLIYDSKGYKGLESHRTTCPHADCVPYVAEEGRDGHKVRRPVCGCTMSNEQRCPW